MSGGNDCTCGNQSPKANGTCANCGHWLPGEREKGPDLAKLWGGGDPENKNSEFAKCATCDHKRIDHIINGGCLTRGCVCMRFAATPNTEEGTNDE